jgi:hypothetical protein
MRFKADIGESEKNGLFKGVKLNRGGPIGVG